MTEICIQGDRFMLNGRLVYAELEQVQPQARGLLMNARFIQGIYDDRTGRERYTRFGFARFDPDANTDRLIAALPAWYAHGLRAFTVGLQGGGPCYTLDNATIDSNPYSPDGAHMDPAWLARLARLIAGADKLGMVVIVSLFYGAQTRFLLDNDSVRRAVCAAASWLRESGHRNLILEIANEHDIPEFQHLPVLSTVEGIAKLIALARDAGGGIPVGCSGTGGYFSQKIAEASDVIFLHGNRQSRQQLYSLIGRAKAVRPVRPVVVNEDSQALSRLDVAFHAGVSWGYYNNATKQEPPTRWEIGEGEDRFFACRMAMGLGLPVKLPSQEERTRLMGLGPEEGYAGKRWIRLASLYPETIGHVDFYRNDVWIDTAFEDPFLVHMLSNWRQSPVEDVAGPQEWRAVIHYTDGSVEVKSQMIL